MDGNSQLSANNFVVMLYPDSKDYRFESVLQAGCDYADEWAWCLHDKFSPDELKDNPDKKPHVHLFLHFKHSRDINTVCRFLFNDLSFSHYIEFAKSRKGSVQYLIHANNPEKWQFDVSDIHSNFDVRPYFDRHFEQKEFDAILNYIDCNPGITIRQLIKWSAQNGYNVTFRRNYFVLKDYFYPNNRH